jgi:uncharacterized RDD family membrane protein YckC
MPETRRPASPVIATAMFVSAVTLAAVAALIYSGVISLGEQLRLIAVLVVSAAAFADFVIAVWFFRKSQSGVESS